MPCSSKQMTTATYSPPRAIVTAYVPRLVTSYLEFQRCLSSRICLWRLPKPVGLEV